MADPKMLRVRLGISEIDSYNMLFYSHYLRYNERAANSCLSPESSSAVLCRVSLAKYMSSVRWNDTVDIRTTAVVAPCAEGQSVQGEYTLLHEWFVAEQYEKPAYLSLCTYVVCGPAGFTGARTPDAREARRIQALQREAGVLFTPQGGSGCSETLPVYPDMIGPGGGLAVPCVMDLFERQRTTLIGGQEELERLKAEENTLIVVYMIQALELPPASAVRAREEIDVTTGFTLQGDGLFYCVKQSVTHRPTGRLCAEGYLKLCFVRDGAAGKAPAATLRRLGVSTSE